MRFALIDNKRFEAQSGLKGICPRCTLPVIAKCGTQRIHHWAHQNTEMCDSWWQPETEWHRSWKDNYAQNWQEVIQSDELTGERHVADICTPHSLVIEFQHSPILLDERISREKFYKDMVWVVNGLKHKYAYKRFVKFKGYAYQEEPSVYKIFYPEKCFPLAWIESSVPVVFDFGEDNNLNESDRSEHKLYCLFPGRVGGRAKFAEITKKAFISHTTNGNWQSRIANCLKKWKEVEHYDQKQFPQDRTGDANFEGFRQASRYIKSRL